VLEKIDDFNATIRFAVIDTGIGILRRNKKKTFKLSRSIQQQRNLWNRTWF
jgi:hypothetical protein